jgi:hypothetical protein
VVQDLPPLSTYPQRRDPGAEQAASWQAAATVAEATAGAAGPASAAVPARALIAASALASTADTIVRFETAIHSSSSHATASTPRRLSFESLDLFASKASHLTVL